MNRLMMAALLMSAAQPALAQTGPTALSNPSMQQTAMPAPIAPAGTLVLRAGTSVPVKFLEGLTTEGKKLKVGHRFRLETSEAINLNSMTIIPVGSPVVGEVVSVRNKGMWGKSDKIEVRIVSVTVGDRQIRLSGSTDDKGVTGTAGVVGAIALVPIAGFFVTGTSARIPAGSITTAFTEEDVPVVLRVAAAPRPLVASPATAGATAAAAPQ